MTQTAIRPTRAQNYPEWYQQVISAAELAENSPVRGCMVIRPWGYAIWERMQANLDRRIKATGHVNAYFPLLIPLSYLEKEAEHIEGFAKECAVVTHHRLKDNGHGKLIPDGELEEPYIIRPTSETVIGEMYSRWIQSYRDLPLLINQWANVMRWEMRTRLFLRTSEFLWQEGHTAHATPEEAMEETRLMLDVYAEFSEQFLGIPVIKGEKTESERFPGAVNTYTIEAMMQDGKALQNGTSHFLGQNFSKSSNITFLNQQGEAGFVWTTSWGVSTRMLGALIMTHSDDDGLVLPPSVAPYQVVILPIFRNSDEEKVVLAYCHDLQKQLQQLNFEGEVLRVHVDKRDLRGGEKMWQWVKKGVPVRLEIGPRDIANDSVMCTRRDTTTKDKQSMSKGDLLKDLIAIFDDIQSTLFIRAKQRLERHTLEINNQQDFEVFFSGGDISDKDTKGGFALCFAADVPEVEAFIKPLKVSARCMPLIHKNDEGICIFTGKKVRGRTIFAKAY